MEIILIKRVKLINSMLNAGLYVSERNKQEYYQDLDRLYKNKSLDDYERIYNLIHEV